MYKYHADSITICFYIKLNMIHIGISNLITHLASFPCLSVNSIFITEKSVPTTCPLFTYLCYSSVH